MTKPGVNKGIKKVMSELATLKTYLVCGQLFFFVAICLYIYITAWENKL